MKTSLSRQMGAEFVGTAFLLAAIVGSGIMGERLASGNGAIALLANTLATGAALVALILTFGSISGAHFNPAVTLADASQGGIPWQNVPAYLAAQIVGAFAGVAVAHLMFGASLFSPSRHSRSGSAQVFSEFVATAGLLQLTGTKRVSRTLWDLGQTAGEGSFAALRAEGIAASSRSNSHRWRRTFLARYGNAGAALEKEEYPPRNWT